ncbi:DUF2845 domain-containing protein [Legionella sp. W05-934-2]|jgi:hypothetical protein|uniref:DUF2845 domain-containing protein n=1 Tax=Legionella sp. W05-934-2 TaxID=1198649 RepID=UPI0034622FAA
MKYFLLISGLLAINLSIGFAGTNYFCPGKNQTISVGMSEDQVAASCGQPLSKQQSQSAATEKVPVQQLIYNQAGGSKAFYGVWQIPTGNNHGTSLVVSVMDNKIVDIQMDGGSVNANSICDGGSFSVGDPVSMVYTACGNPSNMNNTFIRKPLPGIKKPETWIYQFGQYQPPLQLKFQGGKLIEINDGS